jgi:hypothetical protein
MQARYLQIHRKSGIGFALALKDDGTVWGWGTNENGELCDGTKEHRLRPVQMKGIANAVTAVVNNNSIVVLTDGTVRMCGSNSDGVLGDLAPRVSEHLTPFQVPGVTGVRSARMDRSTTIVQLADGTLRGWASVTTARSAMATATRFRPSLIRQPDSGRCWRTTFHAMRATRSGRMERSCVGYSRNGWQDGICSRVHPGLQGQAERVTSEPNSFTTQPLLTGRLLV